MSAPSSSDPSSLDQDWFHVDCWGEVMTAKQADYRQNVERDGLAALLAPYVAPMPQPNPAAVVSLPEQVSQVVPLPGPVGSETEG